MRMCWFWKLDTIKVFSCRLVKLNNNQYLFPIQRISECTYFPDQILLKLCQILEMQSEPNKQKLKAAFISWLLSCKVFFLCQKLIIRGNWTWHIGPSQNRGPVQYLHDCMTSKTVSMNNYSLDIMLNSTVCFFRPL